MAVQRSKHFPLFALGDLSFTGSTQIVNPFPGQSVSVVATLKGTAAPGAHTVTAALDAGKGLITVSAFKDDGSGALVAATDAVSVDVLIVRQ